MASALDGVVSKTGSDAVNGKYLKIETDAGYTIVYAHLNKILAEQGQRVERGEAVALSGNTGASTGPHLHYGVYRDGVLQDPMAFVRLEHTQDVSAEYLARGESIE